MHSVALPPTDSPSCYFSIELPDHDILSTESPCSSPTLGPVETPVDPTHPLLAIRDPQHLRTLSSPSSTDAFSSFLQMQSVAAYKHSPSRPRPYPVQNVLHVTSDDSMSSCSSTSSIDSSKSSLDLARCSRCQRTPSINVQTGKSNMVSYGLNLWYCSRCASMVGLTNR